MDSSSWALLLLLVGILLLGAEVFIPSGGLISLAAGLSLLAATLCAWNAWWTTSPSYFWSFLIGMAVLLPSVVSIAFSIWPHTPIGKRAILEAPRPEEIASFVELERHYAQMVGKVGETVSLLNPAGIARIDGERVHCQSEGMIIEARIPVRVIAVHANRVVVRQCSAGELAAETTPPPSAIEGESLDFDIS
jgi:membrane-bound ClpP family serine protease